MVQEALTLDKETSESSSRIKVSSCRIALRKIALDRTVPRWITPSTDCEESRLYKPGSQIDCWVVDRALGRGGMGTVYRCHNESATRIKAAVKVAAGRGEGQA